MSSVGIQQWPNITWGITGFCSLKTIQSEEFTVTENKYYLILEQNTFKDITQDYFSLSLNCTSRVKWEDFNVSTFVQDKYGKLHFVQHKNIPSIQWIYLIWKVRRKDILDMPEYWFSNTVSVVLCFGPFSTIIQNSFLKPDKEAHNMIQTDFQVPVSKCMKSLSGDFCNLLQNETETDVTLKCGDKAFPVHKIILSARSHVFAAMFRNDMSEKRNGIIEITDTEPDILKEFLQYVYTGILTDINENTAPFLYSTAHKYSIDALQSRCVTFLEENLSEANVYDYLILSDVHGDSNFKSRIISFIRCNEKILSTEEWLRFTDDHPKLSIEIYRTLYKNISPVIA